MQDNSRYYYVKDIQQFLEVGRNQAYAIIRDLNKRLADKGYITKRGAVPKDYFRRVYPNVIKEEKRER